MILTLYIAILSILLTADMINRRPVWSCKAQASITIHDAPSLVPPAFSEYSFEYHILLHHDDRLDFALQLCPSLKRNYRYVAVERT